MKKLLVMMMFVVGACSQTGSSSDTDSQEKMKEAFIKQVADKQASEFAFRFYDNGSLLEDNDCIFTIYEMIDDNTAIYKSTDPISNGSSDYYYLKAQIKDNHLWLSNTSVTSLKEAKESTLDDIGELKVVED